MATAKELGLKRGNKIRLATQVYDAIPVDGADGEQKYSLQERGFDMRRGAVVEVLEVFGHGGVRVRYLENEVGIGRNNGQTLVVEGSRAGSVRDIWNDYNGFIPPGWAQLGWEFVCKAAKKYVGDETL